MSEHNPFGRTKQCKGCPWKKSTDPYRDIPNYKPEMHAKLTACQSSGGFGGTMMACHETHAPKEQACVGWLDNQLGVGNNIGVRLAVMGKLKAPLELHGEQHETVERMCKAATRKSRKRVR